MDNGEVITVQPKKTLLAKNFKLTKCGKSGCHSKKLTEDEKHKFSKCNYEGSLKSDQGSKVNVAACNENGVHDIAIVSKKAKFKRNLYRVHSDGKIETSNLTIKTHDAKKPEEELKDGGEDYADDDLAGEDVLLDSEKNAVTIEDLDDNCCRPVKTKCQEDGHSKSCSQEKGKIVCEEGKITCQALRDYYSAKLQKQKEGEKMGEEIKNEKHRDNKYSEEDNEESTEDSYESTDEYDVYEEKKEKKEVKSVKSQHVNDLKPSDLKKLVKKMNKSQKKKGKSKKCLIKSSFRSAAIRIIGCGRDETEICRPKDPIPKEKIYSERTVEFGVYVDMHVYKKMSEILKTTKDDKITEKNVQMVQSLLSEAESYTTHESFTSLKGGFKFAVNGIQIYKELSDEASKKWESSNTLRDLLKEFKHFGYEVNNACDAEEDSFDAMILFTGRSFGGDDARGYAYRAVLCDLNPVMVMIAEPNEQGDKSMVDGKLLAHELGHLFGSRHDGPPEPNDPPALGEVDGSACPEDQNIMSPVVNPDMVSFSDCTRAMIDKADEERKKDKKDCLYT